MRPGALLLLVLAGGSTLLTTSCGDPPPPPDIAVSKQMIWDALKAYHDFGDKRDVDGMASLLAPEVSLVRSHEDVVKGIDAVTSELTNRVKTYEDNSRSTLLGKERIEVTGDMALVTYVANVGTQRGVVSAVMRRSQGKWLIAHIHDTWTAPVPANNPNKR